MATVADALIARCTREETSRAGHKLYAEHGQELLEAAGRALLPGVSEQPMSGTLLCEKLRHVWQSPSCTRMRVAAMSSCTACDRKESKDEGGVKRSSSCWGTSSLNQNRRISFRASTTPTSPASKSRMLGTSWSALLLLLLLLRPLGVVGDGKRGAARARRRGRRLLRQAALRQSRLCHPQ